MKRIWNTKMIRRRISLDNSAVQSAAVFILSHHYCFSIINLSLIIYFPISYIIYQFLPVAIASLVEAINFGPHWWMIGGSFTFIVFRSDAIAERSVTQRDVIQLYIVVVCFADHVEEITGLLHWSRGSLWPPPCRLDFAGNYIVRRGPRCSEVISGVKCRGWSVMGMGQTLNMCRDVNLACLERKSKRKCWLGAM